MDLCSLVWVALILYFSICLAIMCLADSDILTFFYSYYGKTPAEAFDDKVVWVTGSSSGIGEGLAKELAKCNAKIVLTARRKDELERVKSDCLGLNKRLKNEDILVLPMDLTDYSSHQPAFDRVIEHFGRLDVLISNAGRSQRANWVDIELEVDKNLFELNVFSLINLNRIVLRYFLANGRGQLAVTSSVAGKIGAPFSGSYTGSKYALHGYFESLRSEIGNKVPITMLCPGPVFSGFLKEAFTAKTGDKFGQETQATDRRMTADRCGYLSLVAIANGLDEAWTALFPVILVLYFCMYQPFIATKLMKFLSQSGIAMKLRDSRQSMNNE
ncbi:Dehydrogenase/reductase SDR family member 7 [Orchesella cincta]|uniref:Dehydrogenase/reductase SDR family member 7 n=1 Tax=Orchesella cincta TaxID=48709 RepID=A0A1D2MPQ6_ORCCI|nr:Dehydrogenase/reductase SDR family member 7 [Orchesella cincta]